jgi:hypothetical protein
LKCAPTKGAVAIPPIAELTTRVKTGIVQRGHWPSITFWSSTENPQISASVAAIDIWNPGDSSVSGRISSMIAPATAAERRLIARRSIITASSITDTM